jgi:hypothetical protein
MKQSNQNKMETKKEMEKRWLECENLINSIKGTFIDQKQAKHIYELQKGGFTFAESRLDDNTSMVVIQRQYDNENLGDESIFLIRGYLGKKLNMKKDKQSEFTIDFINWLHLNEYKYNPKAKLYQKQFINETLFFSIDELFITFKQQEQ